MPKDMAKDEIRTSFIFLLICSGYILSRDGNLQKKFADSGFKGFLEKKSRGLGFLFSLQT